MRILIIIILFYILFSSVQLFAFEIENPQTVEYAKLQIIQYGNITFSSDVSDVWINLSIPQESSFLKIESINANYPIEYGYDYFGNKIIMLHIKNPEKIVKYKISTIITTTRNNCEKLTGSEWLKPTDLALSTDPLIKEKAEQLTLGILDDFSKIYELAKWTNENVNYSEIYKDINANARDVIINKVGSCDEYSILLLSFARALGYPSAIISGYAYGRDESINEFQPHSWVLIGDIGCWDPTWGQGGFIDALHIPFGKYYDTKWVDVSISYKGNENITAEISPMIVEIKILDYKHSDVVSLKSELISDSLSRGYAVVKNTIISNSCIMTKVKSLSCSLNESPVLENIRTEGIIKVCGKESYFFSIFKIPDNLASPRFIYTCPIITYSYSGNKNTTSLKISSDEKYENANINVNKNTATLGENIEVAAPEHFIFTEHGEFGINSLNITSPTSDFKIWSYKNGGLAEAKVSIVKYKPIDVEIISNDTVKVKNSLNFKIKVTNKLATPQNIIIQFNNETKSKVIDNTEYFDFTFIPYSVEDRIIQVKVSTPHYTTTVLKSINITEEKSWLQEIIDAIITFFKSIFG